VVVVVVVVVVTCGETCCCCLCGLVALAIRLRRPDLTVLLDCRLD
jgi:hypothetical protein